MLVKNDHEDSRRAELFLRLLELDVADEADGWTMEASAFHSDGMIAGYPGRRW